MPSAEAHASAKKAKSFEELKELTVAEEQAAVDKLFADEGFVKNGGRYYGSQWKIWNDRQLVVGIRQAHPCDDQRIDRELWGYLTITPTRMRSRCLIMILAGVGNKTWQPNRDGDLPASNWYSQLIVDGVPEALLVVKALEVTQARSPR